MHNPKCLVGGSENQKGSPNTRFQSKHTKARAMKGQGIPESLNSPQKLWIPLHVSLTPFYREAKGLLHSEITLESKEYSKCEHVQECPLHPVICGTNFAYLQACPLFTLQTRTFEATSLTWSSFDLWNFIRENITYEDLRTEVPQASQISQLHDSRIRSIPVIVKQKQACDMTLIRWLLHTTLES
jgi:hypothetical protein